MSQAIDAAGGLTAEADVTVLNRASKITDGQKIYVPTVGEQQTAAAVAPPKAVLPRPLVQGLRRDL